MILFFLTLSDYIWQNSQSHVCDIWQPQGPKVEACSQLFHLLGFSTEAEILLWTERCGGFLHSVCAIICIRKEKEAVVVGLRSK